MPTVFSDDFEDGDAQGWTTTQNQTDFEWGTSSDSHNGSYALRAYSPAGSSSNGSVVTSSTYTGFDHVEAWVKHESTELNDASVFARITCPDNDALAGVQLDTWGDRPRLDVRNTSDTDSRNTNLSNVAGSGWKKLSIDLTASGVTVDFDGLSVTHSFDTDPRTLSWQFEVHVATWSSGSGNNEVDVDDVLFEGTPPAAPSNLTVGSTGLDAADLSWTDNAGFETEYRVHRSTVTGSTLADYTQVATLGADASSYQDSGLSSDSTYYYRVTAASASLESSPSNEASGTTNRQTETELSTEVARTTDLPAPSGVDATATGNQVDVSWTDNADNEDAYRVWRSRQSGGEPGNWSVWSRGSDWDDSQSQSGQIEHPAGTLQFANGTALEVEDFENRPTGSPPVGWTVQNSNGTVTSARGYSGSQSWAFTNGVSNPNSSITVLAERSVEANQPDDFEFAYYEKSTNNGIAIRLLDADGNEVALAGTGTPQAMAYDGGDLVELINPGDQYGYWRRFTFTFDWANEQVEYLWEDLDGSHADQTLNGAAFMTAGATEIATVQVVLDDRSDADGDTFGVGGNLDVWLDDVDLNATGSLTTATKSYPVAAQPNLTGLDYALGDGSVDVTVRGSPGTPDEETQSVELDGDSSYGLDWQADHTTFELRLDLSTSSLTDPPTISAVALTDPEAGYVQVGDALPPDTTSVTTGDLLDGEKYWFAVEAITEDARSLTAETDAGDPVTATTELPDVPQPDLSTPAEDEIEVEWSDVIDYGDYRVEWRETSDDWTPAISNRTTVTAADTTADWTAGTNATLETVANPSEDGTAVHGGTLNPAGVGNRWIEYAPSSGIDLSGDDRLQFWYHTDQDDGAHVVLFDDGSTTETIMFDGRVTAGEGQLVSLDLSQLSGVDSSTIDSLRWVFEAAPTEDKNVYVDSVVAGDETVGADADDSGTQTLTLQYLEDGEEYEVRMRTETEHVTGDWTTPVAIETIFPAPTDLTATATSKTSVDLSWTDNADDEDGYRVLRKRHDYDFQQVEDLPPNATSYTDEDAAPDTTYTYEVRAYTEHGTVASCEVQAATPSLGVPRSTTGASGWHVEVDHPDGTTLTPPVVGQPKRNPKVNGLPKVRVPVPKDEKWSDEGFFGQPMRVWHDGDEQPIDELVDVEQTPDRTVLVGRGGVELLQRVTEDYVEEQAHVAAEKLITDNTTYEANVDAPATTAETNVLRDADTNSEFEDVLSATISDTDPLEIRNGAVELLQTCFVSEAEDDHFGLVPRVVPHVSASGGEAAVLWDPVHDPEYNFSTEYDIPGESVGVAIRHVRVNVDWTDNLPQWKGLGTDVLVDGNTVISLPNDFTITYLEQDGALRQPEGAVADDSGTLTDETTAATDDTADDMTLLPASPSQGDAYYFGLQGPFDEIDLDVSTPGGGTYSIQWEYYAETYDEDGNLTDSGWRQIPNVSDGTDGFRQSGSVTWSLQDVLEDGAPFMGHTEMTETSVDGTTKYWVRARVDSASSLTTQPFGKQARLRGGPADWHDFTGYPSTLEAGQHTVKVQPTQVYSSDQWLVDAVALFDDRYDYAFDDHVHEENGYLHGPQEYPDAVDVTFPVNDPPGSVTTATGSVTLSGSRTPNSLALSNDSGATWTTENDTTSIQHDWASVSDTVRFRATLGRSGSGRDRTPRTGFEGNVLDSYTLEADLLSIPQLASKGYDDRLVDVLRRIADYGNFVFEFRREDGVDSVEWTQPEQRRVDGNADVVEYSFKESVGDTVEKAVVFGSAKPVREETFTASTTDWVPLGDSPPDNGPIVEGSERVYDESSDEEFERGTHYDMQYQQGKIRAIDDGNSDSGLSGGSDYQIDYRYKIGASHTASDASDPPEVRRYDFPSIPTTDGCEQAAIYLVQHLKDPVQEAEITVPKQPLDWNVVDAIQVPELPTDENLQIRDVQQTPGEVTVRLADRESISDVVSDLRDRIGSVSRQV